MLIFPIGLGLRIPRVPWMCILLAAICIFYSGKQFGVIAQYEKQLTEVAVKDSIEPTMMFLVDLCLMRVASVELCEKISLEASQAYLAKIEEHKEIELDFAPNEFDSRIKNHISEQFPQRQPASAKKTELKDTLTQIQSANRFQEEYVKLINDPASNTDKRVDALASFKKLKNFHNHLKIKKAAAAEQFGLLTWKTLGFLTVIKAQFTHGDWMHLIGNLIMFLLLGVFLESRMGALGVLGVFLVSGTLGLIGHLYLETSDSNILMGASAGVSGVIGAFLALFWNRPMKVWLSWMLVLNRTIYVPTYLILVGIYVIQDLTGALTAGSDVAHDAHLIGLGVGLILGLVHKRFEKIDEECLYPDEEILVNKMKAERDPLEKIAQAKKVLQWNPNHLLALKTAIALEIQEHGKYAVSVASNLTSFLALSIKRKRTGEVLEVLANVPPSASLAGLMARLNLKNQLFLAKLALTQNDWLTSIRIYDSIAHKYKNVQLRSNIHQSVTDLCAHLQLHSISIDPLYNVQFSSDIATVFPQKEGDLWNPARLSS